VFVEGAQGARADGTGCGGAEGVQAGGAGCVGGAVEEVSGGDGLAAGVGEIARAQLRHGEISKHEDAGAAGGARELIERGGKRGPGRNVVAGSQVNMADRRDQVSGHCCIKAKGALVMNQSGEANPSDTLENRNKPGI
jgi:hypothetical protein